MNVIAIDPGQSELGWAFLRGDGARARYVSSGKAEATAAGFARLILNAGAAFYDAGFVGGITLVAIERPRGAIFQKFRAGPLLDTAYVAGVIAGICAERGIATVEMMASEVRKLLVGRSRGGKVKGGGQMKKGDLDDMVAEAVFGNLIGAPRSSSVDSRDALALGIVAIGLHARGVRRAV